MRSLRWSFVLAATLLPGVASSTSPHGTVGGMDLEYAFVSGSAASFWTSTGNGYVDGSYWSIGSSTYSVGSDVIVDSNTMSSTTLSAWTFYYIYLTENPNASSMYPIISLTLPNTDGHPSSALAYSGDPGGSPTTSAVYIGSFATDDDGDEIPYTRNGEEVIFNPPTWTLHSGSTTQYLGYAGPPIGVGFQQITLTASSSPGSSSYVYFGNGAGTNQPLGFPVGVGSAMVVDLTVANTATQVQSFYILNAFSSTTISWVADGGPPSNAPVCSVSGVQYQDVAPPAGHDAYTGNCDLVSPVTTRIRVQPYPEGGGAYVNVGWCNVPQNSIYQSSASSVLTVTYSGYVDHVFHIFPAVD
jgi:hypothetical protein